MAGTHTGALNEELQCMKSSSTRALWKGLLWEGPYIGTGEV